MIFSSRLLLVPSVLRGLRRLLSSSSQSSRTGLLSKSSNNSLSYGQPTFESHPEHFQNPHEVIPGVSKDEFKNRRSMLCSRIVKSFNRRQTDNDQLNHLILIPGSAKKYMSENIPYPFRQNSNFFYYSGSYDPEAVQVFTIINGKETHYIFLNDPDPITDLWDGPKTSAKAGVEHFGFDESYLLSEFDTFLREYAHRTNNKFVIWCEDRNFVERIKTHFFTFDVRPTESPKQILDSLRVIKSPAEVKLMEKSGQISSEAFQQTIKLCGKESRAGRVISEHRIWAKLDYECRSRGADRLAYPPVVAGGPRANIIHYVFNTNKCDPNEMVLVDAGCEFFGYCSDITRTWPVSGKFTDDRHRSLYEMVLHVQSELINKVSEGISLEQLFRSMGPLMFSGLQELGIISNSLVSAKCVGTQEVALRFCPHHVSHFLGMDVHDTPAVERNRPLRAGMVITVEPGVYIRASSTQKDLLTKVGREFDGIGIRIEDDVLVTQDGNSVLTAACPKTVKDIEYWGTLDD